MSESLHEYEDVEAGQPPGSAAASAEEQSDGQEWNGSLPEPTADADQPSPNGVLKTLRETAEELLSLLAEWERHARDLQTSDAELQERSERVSQAEEELGRLRGGLEERERQVAEAEAALAALGHELSERYPNSPH